jgi:hypothetical protein
MRNLQIVRAEPDCKLQFESFARVIRGAKPENRLACFGLIARDACRGIDLRKQELVDRLWWLAEDSDLITQFGVVTVQAALVSGFDGR